MRWPAFIITTMILIVIQASVLQPLGLGPQRIVPDLLFILGLTLAMRAEKNPALLACWILGLVKDLTGQAPLGCNALAFGLAGVFLVTVRDFLYGNRPMVLIPMTAILSFLEQGFELWIILVKQEAVMNSWRAALLNIVFSALFTAALAPYMSWIISSLHYSFGLPGRRRF